jgi:hypothetical protein
MRARDRRRIGTLFGYVAFAAVLAAIAAPFYLFAPPVAKPLVMRIAAACLVGIILIRLRIAVRQAAVADEPSPFDRAAKPVESTAVPDPFFMKLREELRVSTGSALYFEQYLWPRLRRLAARRGRTPHEIETAQPANRRFPRRGPSLQSLGRLIEGLERQP